MSLTPAPFHAEIANGPDGGCAYWLTTSDGVRIRIGVWGGGDKGTVLLFPGRTEYIEKYGPAAKGFMERGFSTVAIDWRGQGLADRALDNRLIGHVDAFNEYQTDIAAVMAALPELNLPEPMGLLGHSMGGCIGLRALMKGLPVDAAVFTGPMWGIALDPLRRSAGWALSTLTRQTKFEKLMAPGTTGQSYVLVQPFEDNMLTRDAAMYEGMRQQLEAYPELALGGPSFAWLNEALKECRALSLSPTPNVPTITFLGTNERIVDAKAIHDRMARWHNGELRMVDGAEHEVIMDLPDVQAEVYDATVELFLGALEDA
ncbi:lysophospholipase [Litoreibacter ascidiaceicola]|uniref:Lysophospholipase n=1 Tax=Litoreibacter ascidiaceicola TaxID=1486859 RepID=A0A1M4TUR0_9RHOB|nr:alpha/beta hydrolase [Litoreibacter ascidiaceicola]SHE48221.1 lysophospholipase [Litoreibacter ascidiaceicola]